MFNRRRFNLVPFDRTSAVVSEAKGSFNNLSAATNIPKVKWSGKNSILGISGGSMYPKRTYNTSSAFLDTSTIIQNIERVLGIRQIITPTGTLVARPISLLSELVKSHYRVLSGKVLIYFDSENPMELTDHDIVSIDLLEETKADDASPFGKVSANTLTITINNLGGLFNPNNINSIYFDKMKSMVKVQSFVGLVHPEDETIISYADLGTYYTSAWKEDEWTLSTVIDCYDKLYFLNREPVPNIVVQEGITYYDFLVKLFTLKGLTSSQYVIDDSLRITVPYLWVTSNRFTEQLQSIAEATNSAIYMDRFDRIIVRPYNQVSQNVLTITGDDLVTKVQAPTDYDNTYSQVVVKPYNHVVDIAQQIAKIDSVTLQPGINTIDNCSFSNSPIYIVQQVVLSNVTNCELVDIDYSTEAATVTINNTLDTPQTATIEIIGQPFKSTSYDIKMTDNSLYTGIGSKVLQIDNPLMQDDTHARSITTSIFNIVTNPNNTLTVDNRGNPYITIGNALIIDDQVNYINNVKCYVTRHTIKYDGGLSSTITCTKIKEG